MSVSSAETRQGIFAILVSLPMTASLCAFVMLGSGLLI
jgi:hypothetical protein